MANSSGRDQPRRPPARDPGTPGGPPPREGRRPREGGARGDGRAPGDAKPIASFIVEFLRDDTRQGSLSTKAHHIEADDTESWSGIEAEGAYRWILERLREVEATREPDAEGKAEREPESAGGRLDIETAELIPALSLTSNEPLELRMRLMFQGPGAIEAGKRRAHYTARLFARELTTSQKMELGEPMRGIVPAEGGHREVTLRAAAPPAGLYRLDVVAMVEDGGLRPGYFEMPLLRVV